MATSAMFDGLVRDTAGRAVSVSYVGDRACYVVDDDGFLRHIDAERVDRAVLGFIKSQVADHKDLAVGGVMEMLGKDDLFTKAAVESSIDKMDQAPSQPLPTEAKQMLGMLGFRIVIDDQGNLADIEMPGGGIVDED